MFCSFFLLSVVANLTNGFCYQKFLTFSIHSYLKSIVNPQQSYLETTVPYPITSSSFYVSGNYGEPSGKLTIDGEASRSKW